MKKSFTLKIVFLSIMIASNFASYAQSKKAGTIKSPSNGDTTKSPDMKGDTTKTHNVVPDTVKSQNLEEDTVKRDSTIIQAKKPRTVFLEVGGPGLALTINYDTRFKNTRDKWGYRVGMGYYNTGSNSVFSIPLQVNYLWGFGQTGGDSFLEVGGGTTFVYSKGSTGGTYFQLIT